MVDAKRQTLATNGSRNRQRPCPLGAFYGQEAVFIGVRARIASTDMKTAVLHMNSARQPKNGRIPNLEKCKNPVYHGVFAWLGR
jgi:hypothetical protein